jgi:hypothetical protein
MTLKHADKVPDEMRKKRFPAKTVGELIELLERVPAKMPLSEKMCAGVTRRISGRSERLEFYIENE